MRAQELRSIDLGDTETTIIDKIGIYIKPAYRSKNIGNFFIKCLKWSLHNNLCYVQVDIELTNFLTRHFWLGFFKDHEVNETNCARAQIN
jgi:hypothetical protein